MKRTNLKWGFLGLVCLSGLISCSDDDSNSASIIGGWNRVRTITQIGNDSPVENPYNGNEIGCDRDYIEFRDSELLRDVVWYKNSEEICTEDVEELSWAKEGDLLTIDSDVDDPETFTVTRLTNSTLEYRSEITTSGVVIKVTQVFSRR